MNISSRNRSNKKRNRLERRKGSYATQDEKSSAHQGTPQKRISIEVSS